MRTSGVAEAVRRFMAHVPGAQGAGIVAVSGGADSVALLRALQQSGCAPLVVAHFNHHLRGTESADDARFVRELASQLGLPFRLGEEDVAAAAARTRENLEATARRVRYAWLGATAAEVGAAWVATGHTADDQAETLLHRLIRGTGLQGLRGIASVQTGPAGLAPPTCLVRPILSVTRAEVLDYLASLDQPFREDSSNADPRFTRNRIRAELVPLLKTFNPEVVSVLGRLAGQAAEVHDVLIEQARRLLERAERPRADGRVILDVATLTAAPPALIRAALRLVWEREGWPMGNMGHDQWDRAVGVVQHLTNKWDFPGGISARRRGRVVQIGRAS